MVGWIKRTGPRRPASLGAAVVEPAIDQSGTLDGLIGSVKVGGGLGRRLLAALGPGWLVAVGYMDPGNWATSLAAGSRYGYDLLFVALLANLMAIVLQSLAIRLGIASERDLARACRDWLPAGWTVPLWLMAEVAIVATDLAEVIGTAIGLQLLFGIPLAAGVVITALDVFVVLALQRYGFRRLEIFVVVLIGVITASFAAQVFMARPDWGGVARGFVPDASILSDPAKLYLALGILGATVMPHNLFLHSAVVRTRGWGRSEGQKREAIGLATLDTVVALTLALAINAAILILAAAAFHTAGHSDVAELGDAHGLLAPILGSTVAPSLFAVALIACGLNSSITATLAGQTVMEGFVHLTVVPWVRRLVTRGLAIVPAAIVTIVAGDTGTGSLLILSQVILSLQLPFAIVPLIAFTASRRRLDRLVAPRWLTVTAVAIAVVVIGLNGQLVAGFLGVF